MSKLKELWQKLVLFLKKKETSEASNINFHKLTPIVNKELSNYKNAFEFVFKNNDIHNIGITGPYCSGKTSLIKTFAERYKVDFLYISLTSFNEEFRCNVKDNDDNSENKYKKQENNEYLFEGCLINQLIHQIKPENIKESIFQIKVRHSDIKIIHSTLKLFIFFVSMLFLFYQSKLISFIKISNDFRDSIYFGLIIGLSILISAIGFYLFLRYIVSINFRRHIFKKLSVLNNELEICECYDESAFYKYLSEILYLFDNSGHKNFVFEDIDRLSEVLIFQRIRELNILLNKKCKDPPFRFFYALKDDLFSSKERAKFFDFIIPVVPVVDSTNSYDLFIDGLRCFANYNKLNQSLIRDVSLYIDDMRLIKNICNEYIIYHSQLTGKTKLEIDYNKLFAIMVYKNLFPNDFTSLQYKTGLVYNIIYKKEEWLLTEDVNGRGHKNKTLKDLLTKERFDLMLTNSELSYPKHGFYIDAIFYLLKNGYIDENYCDYMTYFYENSLRISDKNFILSIKNETAKDSSQHIYNPELVLTYLSISDFSKKESLNFDLINHLLASRTDLANEYLNEHLSFIHKDKNFDFLLNFIEVCLDVEVYEKKLNRVWQRVIFDLIHESKSSGSEVRNYIVNAFQFSSLEEIRNLNIDDCIVKFISTDTDFIKLKNVNVSKIIEAFMDLNIKMSTMNHNDANDDLFKEIYGNNLYELNFDNALLMVKVFYGKPFNEKTKEELLSIVFSNKNEQLYKYIESEIDSFLLSFLKSFEGSVNDDSKTVVEVLNNEKINEVTISEYISKMKNKIITIKLVRKDLWKKLIDCNKIECNHTNILDYFEFRDFILDNSLVQFIVINIDFIDLFNSANLPDEYEETTSSLYKEIVKNTEIALGEYEAIITKFRYTILIPSLVENLPFEYLRILVNKHNIQFNEEFLNFYRKRFPENVNVLILPNIDDYIKIINTNETLFIAQEIIDILSIQKQKDHIEKLLSLVLVNHDKLNVKNVKGLLSIDLILVPNTHQIVQSILLKCIDLIIENEITLSLDFLKSLLMSEITDTNQKKSLIINHIASHSKEHIEELISITNLRDFEKIFSCKECKIGLNKVNLDFVKRIREKEWIKKFNVVEEESIIRVKR